MGRYQAAIYTFGILVPCLVHHEDDDKEEEDLVPVGVCEVLGKYPAFCATPVVDLDSMDDDGPIYFLISDARYHIESAVKGYPDSIRVGCGFGPLLKELGATLGTREDFAGASRLLSIHPEWHNVFTLSY